MIYNVFWGIVIICLGVGVYKVQVINWRGGEVDLSSPYLHFPFLIICVIFGLYIIIKSIKDNSR